VLSLTVSEGFIRVFINEGEPMAALLRHALERGIFPEYVKQLLAVFGEVPRIFPEPTTTSVPASPLLDPLTERELEVLRLLQSSLTHSEIADELFISVSTVRSHVKRIYSKLDVHNRMEAVEHAREIGLIRG